MRKLSENAVRAKHILEREGSPLSAECERMLLRELERTLSAFFDLTGELRLQLVREGRGYAVSVHANAAKVRPFGVVK